MKNSQRINRLLEIIPGSISWCIIILFILLAVFKPVTCAVFIIIFDFYWIIRTCYLTTLLLIAHHKLSKQEGKDWLKECENIKANADWKKLYHLIIFPIFKEGPDVLKPSLQALLSSHYPRDKMIVLLSFEERNQKSRENAFILEAEFKKEFFAYISTFHPDNIPGECRTKGANATWAGKQAKQFLDTKGIPHSDVIISCFDADTCVDKEYFGCLTYHFIASDKPHQASYQPMPVYNNNVWYAPAFARLVEISSSFSQLIESMRLEKFVTFSSHSMSFKTLVDIDYWPVDMISDDSVIYWKAYLFHKGNYRVVPLYVTVSMDVAYGKNLFETIRVQYKQKRRWAWGVEIFPFLVSGFISDKEIPLVKKIRRSFHLLDSHITWAVWAIIMFLIGPLPLLFGGTFFRQMAIGYNLPKITGLLFNFTLITSLVWIILSRTTLPARPKDVSRIKSLAMILQWLIVPFVILILGSTPALDAQTRLMLGRYMQFNPTEKIKKMV